MPDGVSKLRWSFYAHLTHSAREVGRGGPLSLLGRAGYVGRATAAPPTMEAGVLALPTPREGFNSTDRGHHLPSLLPTSGAWALNTNALLSPPQGRAHSGRAEAAVCEHRFHRSGTLLWLRLETTETD